MSDRDGRRIPPHVKQPITAYDLTRLVSHDTVAKLKRSANVNEKDSTFLTHGADPQQAVPSEALPFVEHATRPEPIGFVPIVEIPGDEKSTAGRLACGTLAWRHEESWRLTVVLKATFDMSRSPMTLVAPEPIALQDRHHRGNPMAHVVVANDLAPYRPHSDITVAGHACAPSGTTVSELDVRLAVRRGTNTLLDKHLRVVGTTRDGAPQPFDRIRISYDRAFGGLGCAANPIGCGAGGDAERPNVLDLRDPETPGGFGATSEGWPQRKKLLGGAPKPTIAGASMTVADSVDWGYFQTAPADQQVAYLSGDETFILEGLSPDLPVIETSLPEVCATGSVFGLTSYDESAPLELHLDTVHLDSDAMRCSLAWRAVVPVEAEGLLPGLLVAAGLTIDGWQLGLPDERPPAPAPDHPSTQRAGADWKSDFSAEAGSTAASEAAGATMGIGAIHGIQAPVTPFRSSSPPSSRGPASGYGSSPPPDSSQTLAVPLDELMAPPPSSRRGTPFDPDGSMTRPALEIDRATPPSSLGGGLPFRGSTPSSPAPAALGYKVEAEALVGETVVVESVEELEAQIAKIEAEKEIERQTLAEQEAKQARAKSEEEERRAAAAEAEERRREQSLRFEAEQAAAREKEQQQEAEAESNKKKAGLNFRRHARRGFKRNTEN